MFTGFDSSTVAAETAVVTTVVMMALRATP